MSSRPPSDLPSSLPSSHQGLDAFIDEARRRQDALVEQVRLLAEDSRGIEGRLSAIGQGSSRPSAPVPEPGLLASLGRRLRRRRATAATPQVGRAHVGERVLRARVDEALAESKRASWLADRFAALREDLDSELHSLHRTCAAAARESTRHNDLVIAARLIADDDSAEDAARDAAGRDRATAERQVRVLSLLEERAGVLAASARGIIDVVDALHEDVAAFAAAAARHTESLSARARAVGVAEDARSVLDELEGALAQLGGTLDEASVFAAAVTERMASVTTADPAFAESLETLVQGAIARRAARDAHERARGLGPAPAAGRVAGR